MVIYSHLLLFF
jgi:hypothetical protein